MEEVLVSETPLGKMKRFRQSTGYYCGPATIQMLLSQFDIETKQIDIAKAGSSMERVKNLGMSVNELAKAVHKIAPDLWFWVKRDSTLQDLHILLKEFQIPVGINWQGVFENFEYGNELNNDENEEEDEDDDGSIGDQGHYVVAVDIDLKNGFIRIADPYGSYSGKDRFFPLDLFDERWWDDLMEKEGGINKYSFESHLMFTLTKRGDERPKQVGMKEI